MKNKNKKVLYFINGAVATDAENESARNIEGNVVFRNAHHVPHDGALEDCDAVCGTVPERYLSRFQSIGTADLYNPEFDPANAVSGSITRNEDGSINYGDAPNAALSVGKAVNGHTGITNYDTLPATTSTSKQHEAVVREKRLAQFATVNPTVPPIPASPAVTAAVNNDGWAANTPPVETAV